MPIILEELLSKVDLRGQLREINYSTIMNSMTKKAGNSLVMPKRILSLKKTGKYS